MAMLQAPASVRGAAGGKQRPERTHEYKLQLRLTAADCITMARVSVSLLQQEAGGSAEKAHLAVAAPRALGRVRNGGPVEGSSTHSNWGREKVSVENVRATEEGTGLALKRDDTRAVWSRRRRQRWRRGATKTGAAR